jgi:hypothetical protein
VTLFREAVARGDYSYCDSVEDLKIDWYPIHAPVVVVPSEVRARVTLVDDALRASLVEVGLCEDDDQRHPSQIRELMLVYRHAAVSDDAVVCALAAPFGEPASRVLMPLQCTVVTLRPSAGEERVTRPRKNRCSRRREILSTAWVSSVDRSMHDRDPTTRDT